MSSPDINYPQQPTYGEGMADAMKAQMEQLLGQGDFADIYADAGFEGGNLADIIRDVEAPLRQQTAQTDTDVLRQTLLGTRQESTSGTYDDEGRLVVGYEGGKEATTRTKTIEPEVTSQEVSRGQNPNVVRGGKARPSVHKVTFKDPNTGKVVKEGFTTSSFIAKPLLTGDIRLYSSASDAENVVGAEIFNADKIETTISIPPKDAVPVYAKDPNGNIIVDKAKAGQTETIPASFAGDGMINLLGDSRSAIDPATGLPSDRQAGFDADGNFLGLSALAEDIQRGNLSRQREADLADVERLSDRYQDVMADYKPAATSGLDDARILLEQQRENLTGLRKATQADVDAKRATEVGELFQTGQGQGSGPISMPSTLDSADYAMSGDAAIGQLDSGEDTLRSALLADARGALNEGLTDREMKQVEESARARQTLMGRTFDQKGAIEEAEARVKEDNQRKMQNRAFAQSALGQEAGIQTGDAARAMTADQFNVGAKMDAERLNEQLRQQGLSNYINAVGNLAQMEDKFMLDPFQALLGRGGGNALQQGQSVFGQANYGLSSGPQYLNPEAGLGYISNMAANQANMYGAQLAADASRTAGIMGGLGSLGGGLLSNSGLFGG
jgi:hypothetical protein